MEPTIIAAVVTTAGSLLGRIIDRHGTADKKTQERAREVAEKTYEVLRGNFSDGCVRVLKMLEAGSLLSPAHLRERHYPTLNLPSNCVVEFDTEYRFRLEYLRLNGVVTLIAGRVYGITELGSAFLEEARRRRDYFDELFTSNHITHQT